MLLQETRSSTSTAVYRAIDRMVRDLARITGPGRHFTEDLLFVEANRNIRDLFTAIASGPRSATRLTAAHLSPTEMAELTRAHLADLDWGYWKVTDMQTEASRRYARYDPRLQTLRESVDKMRTNVSRILRRTEGDAFEIEETFGSLSGLILPDTDPMAIDREAGVATLPVEESIDLDLAKVQVTAPTEAVILPDYPATHLLDNNADTRFVIRRPIAGEADGPLTIQILLTFRTPQMVNQLRIVPWVDATRTFARVDDIETSLDGKAFRSIRDRFPTFFDAAEEEAFFTLGPEGLRNQTAAQFPFAPRIAQYLRLTLTQSRIVERDLERYQEISIRDLGCSQTSYVPRGSIETEDIDLPFLPTRIQIVETAMVDRPLTELVYQLSFDRGVEWYALAPGATLEINTGTPEAVQVPVEARSVRVRTLATREDTSFSGIARPLAGRISSQIQRLFSVSPPTSIQLTNIPIEDSFQIFASALQIGNGIPTFLFEARGEDNLRIQLPISITPFSETVTINGEAWSRTRDLALAGPDDRVYEINYTEDTLRFGDSRVGLAPNGKITITIDEERARVLADRRIEIDHYHDFNPDHIRVEHFGRIQRTDEIVLEQGVNEFTLETPHLLKNLEITEDLPAGSTTFYLTHIPATLDDLVFSDRVRFATRVTSDPASTGQYRLDFLTTEAIAPVRVTVFGGTHATDPGTVTLEAIAIIIDPTSSYTRDDWLATLGYPDLDDLGRKVLYYSPQFSDTTVFANEQTYLDGRNELAGPGDYSIDYTRGKVYAFLRTPEDTRATITYSYQERDILPWTFATADNQLQIADETFRTNRNDSMPVILSDNGTRSYVIYRDQRWIRIPTGTSSPYNGLTFTAPDYLRGTVLPAGRRRVALEHASLIEGSLRFLHLSDDLYSYDDVTTERADDGTVTLIDRAVRDLYGNPLSTAAAAERTQRDVDRTYFVHERVFVDGRTELKAIGDYSVDYENGVLYTFGAIPAHTILQYEYADIRVSYTATRQLVENDHYAVDFTTLQATLHGFGEDTATADVVVKYDIVEDLQDDPVAVVGYYSPILFQYRIRFKP